MPSWSDLATACTIATLIAAAADATLHRNEKTIVHKRLVQLWKRLDKRRVPDIPAATAGIILTAIRSVFGSRVSLRAVLISVGLSCVLTAVAANLGTLVQGLARDPHAGLNLFNWEAYAINYVFDAATVVTAAFLLKKMSHGSSLAAPAWGVLNLAVGIALAIASALATNSYSLAAQRLDVPYYRKARADYQYWNLSAWKSTVPADQWKTATEITVEPWSPGALEQIRWILASATYWTGGPECCHTISLVGTIHTEGRRATVVARARATPMLLSGVLFAATTLIPIAVLTFLILFGWLGKLILAVVRATLLRLLRVATEANPRKDPRNFMPATLLALVLGAMACLLKAVTAIL